MPERNAAPDAIRSWARARVVPRGFSIHLLTDDNVVVARNTFPVTGRMAVAGPEMLRIHLGKGKALISDLAPEQGFEP